MNRLLTLTSGGIAATMAILPIGAFAQSGAAATQDNKTPATMSAPASKTDTTTAGPVTAQSETPKATGAKSPAHKAKTMESTKHTVSAETQKASTHRGVQPKVTDQNKS